MKNLPYGCITFLALLTSHREDFSIGESNYNSQLQITL